MSCNNNMTKEKLEQYLDLKREIRHLESALRKYTTEAPPISRDVIVKSQRSLPYKKISSSVIGIDYDKIDATSERLKRKLKRAASELNEIENFIDSIDDSQIRQIIYWRYIKGNSWVSVAFKIGKHDEQRPRKILNKFLKKDEKDETGVVK